MISLYRPGTSLVHRLPAGTKLAGLTVAVLGVSVYPHGAVSIAVVLALVALGYATAGLRAAVFLRQLWQLRILVVALAVFLTIFTSPEAAWINTGRVVAVVTLASLLTLTTRMGDLLDVLNRMLRPLGRLGVNAQAVSMAISLCIAMVPVIVAHATGLREAQRARNVRLGMRIIVPLLVATLRHADDVGDAMAARGIA